MRFLKYLAVILIILAIIVAGANFYRESIALNVANSALSGRGFVATDISIDSLQTDYIRLSLLVLEQDDGAQYRISGLTFPTSFPSDKAETILVDQFVSMPADSPNAPPPFARLLETFLQLPDYAPNTEISISQILLPGIPAITNFVWKSTGQQQQLAFHVDSIDVSLGVTHNNEREHQLIAKISFIDNPNAFSSSLALRREESGFTIDGFSSIEMSPWVPILRKIGLLPADVVSLHARLSGPISAFMNDDENVAIPVTAQLSLTGEMITEYSSPDIRLQATSAFPAELLFEYPSFDWSANIEQLDTLISIDAIDKLPIRIDDLACQVGIRCSFQAILDAGPVELGNVIIDNTKLLASLMITVDDNSRSANLQNLTATLTDIESAEFAIASLDAKNFSGARFESNADGWHFDAENVDLMVGSASNRNGLIASAPVSLKKVRLRDSASTISAGVSIQPSAAALSWNEFGFVVPGVEGKISQDGDQQSLTFMISDDVGAFSSNIDAVRNQASGTGSVSVRDTTFDFTHRPIANYLTAWPYAWNIVAGTWATQADFAIGMSDDGIVYQGTAINKVDSLAGSYNDVAFKGLTTLFTANLDSATGGKLSDSTLEVAVLDVGIPLENIVATYALDTAEESLQVSSLSMSVLGGEMVTDAFLFDLRKATNDITLRPQSIQLQFMVDLAEFEDIELSGSISGVIPVTVSEKTITISDGRLESDPPGGVIRYLPGLETDVADDADSGLGLVTRALANFQFDSLSSDVNYNDNGDLALQMRLEGINPDLDPNQPVILNLGVENNVPELLRSLRATRSIEEILEKRNPQIRR